MSGSPVGSKSSLRARQASRRGMRVPAFWLFVGPFLAGLVAFTFVPIGWGFVLLALVDRGDNLAERYFTSWAREGRRREGA